MKKASRLSQNPFIFLSKFPPVLWEPKQTRMTDTNRCPVSNEKDVAYLSVRTRETGDYPEEDLS